MPDYPERGVGGYAGPVSAGSGGAGQGTQSGSGFGAGSASTSGVTSGDTTQTAALSALQSTSFGATAISTANQIGVSTDAVASIGVAESGLQNINNGLGTSAATGPWQIVPATFAATSQKYGLGYTAADINNPQAQAVEASYIIRETAQAVSAATQQPASVLQTYTGYVFGPSNGAKIATASPDALLSGLLPASYLSNNGIPASTTVGQLNANYAARLGAAANRPALTPS